MSKEQLIDLIVLKAGLESKAAGERALDAALESMQEALAAGDEITLRGFGTFYVTTRAGRKGRHPRTGQPIDIPAAKVVKFRPGKDMEEAAEAMHTSTVQKWMKKKEITRNVESGLKDIKSKLDTYKVKADKMGSEAKQSYQENVERMKPVYDKTRLKLKLLKSSSGDAWDEMRDGLVKAYGELREAFKKAREKF